MTTYRERRLAKADRLREWAEKREAKGTASVQQGHAMFDVIPFGQPILVGHYSERGDRNYRARAAGKLDRGLADLDKARSMAARADGIEAAADRAIYSDDPDAVERLRERVAALEAERDRVKAYNASCRKGAPDPSLLDDAQRAEIAGMARFSSFMGKGGAFPAYHLSNLGGNITRNRARLAQLERLAAVAGTPAERGRQLAARYGGTCAGCGETFAQGDTITYYRSDRSAYAHGCSR